MKKKIIAIISVVILLAAIFTACGKVPTVKGDNGMEYAVVTDGEGNTVVNDNGDIVVYVTDENGKFVKDENGEKETNALKFPERILDGQKFETPDYTLTMPKGWTSDEYGKFTLDGSDENVYVKVVNFGELQKDQTIEDFVNEDAAANKAIFENAKDEIGEHSVDVQKTKVGKAEAVNEIIHVKDKDGKVIFHAEGIYYMYGTDMFKVEYICNNQYDETINIGEIVNSALKMK